MSFGALKPQCNIISVHQASLNYLCESVSWAQKASGHDLVLVDCMSVPSLRNVMELEHHLHALSRLKLPRPNLLNPTSLEMDLRLYG